MCLDHIESGRRFLWNAIGITDEDVISADAYVYALRGESKLKFGYTRTVDRRFKSIKVESKDSGLVLSGFVNGSRRLEALVLAFASPDQLHGEWFRDTPRTRFIETLIATASADAVWNGLRERAQQDFPQ